MLRILTLIATLVAFLSGPAAAADAPVKALVGGAVVDLERGRVIENAVVVIEGERIAAVGAAGEVAIPAEAERIDAAGRYLLPGFMNMHVHFGLKLPGAAGAALVNETEAELAIRMANNARKTLYAGATTVRLVAEEKHADFAVKAAIDRGDLPGPRVFSAGEPLIPTGGHGADLHEDGVDGPYEAMAHTRRQMVAGATWIKLMISKGLTDLHGDIAASDMTLEEMRAVTDIAHRQGVKVTAHSGSPRATMEALKAGVDSFEHGYFLTPEVFRAMKREGAWYIPTIVVSQEGIFEFFEKIGAPPWYLARARQVGANHWQALQWAIDVGVDIAMGSDQFPYETNQGTYAQIRETELYVEAGMTPLRALRAAMVEPARLLGEEDDLGGIAPGKYADLIGVTANPLEDIRALRTMNFVMKGGEVFRDE